MHERWPAKHHSKEDFRRAASLCKDVALTLNPTFVAFTPWTSLEGYVGLSAIWTSTSSRTSRRCSTGYG